MKGTKPKPAEIKRRTGSRHATEAVVVGGRGRPRVPAYLSGPAKTAWKHLVDDMDSAGLLDKADWPLLEVAANAIATYRHAIKMCQSEGLVADGQKGSLTTSPWYRIQMEQSKEIRQLLEHLGIGPVGRSRLGLAAAKGKDVRTEMESKVPERGLSLVQGGKA